MSIVQQITRNPEGGTVAIVGTTLPKTGYFVGGIVASLIVDTDPGWAHDSRPEIEFFVNYLTERVGAGYVGWWTDEETGKVYIDGTTWHETYDEAERVTRERNEIAFWDIERQREFRPVIIEGE